ncbi:MAG: hypothetical protein MN733_24640 [Nitrososphaera sp.]|nr:hypothetical protein [Nitrososphaera sp.]
MKGKKSSWNRWLSWRTVIVTRLSSILVVIYGIAFLVYLFVSWLWPGNTALVTNMERCLTILTPLIAVFVHHYLQQRKQNGESEEG